MYGPTTPAVKPLNITLIQSDIVWEDKEANLRKYEQLMAGKDSKHQLIVLPEMFTTGFSMDAERLAEPMDGLTVKWMAEKAAKCQCVIVGSLIIAEDGNYYNRMVWVQPDGHIGTYDKRHLFAYGGEDKHYSPGKARQIVQVNGWRINLQVCYDLRFPVWARNQKDEYDVLLYVANWPQQRSLAWKTLLQARAIENMCYVIGVNRVGTDPMGNIYSGDSRVISPLGEILWEKSNEAVCYSMTLDKQSLVELRTKLPFLQDADKYILI